MLYYSTRKQSPMVPLKEAIMRGPAPDGGLYLPQRIKLYPPAFYKNLAGMSLRQISFVVAEAFWGDDLPADLLQDIIYDAMDFDIPLVEVEPGKFVLELYHGPTFSYSDVGVRFASRILRHFYGDVKDRPINVFAATTGDTGAAIAHAFAGVPGFKAFILYPAHRVSPVQERQIATYGGNIIAVEVDGTFDDCQRLVRNIFADKELSRLMTMTTATSVNVARLLPQSFFYFYAYASLLKLVEKPGDLVMSIPTGNVGNLVAGLISKQMGLPVKRFIAATPSNHPIVNYLATGHYKPKAPLATLARAMDVGAPSNIERIREIYAQQPPEALHRDVLSASYANAQIGDTMRRVYEQCNYLLEPHGAIAYKALADSLQPGEVGISLEPVHPAKYFESIAEIVGVNVPLPRELNALSQRRLRSIPVSPAFSDLKDLLLRYCLA